MYFNLVVASVHATVLIPAMDLLHTDLWETELLTETSLDYEKWLPEWKKQLSLAPVTPTVPAVAQTISTPLNLSVWCYFLRGYPDRDLVHFFLQGLSKGFRQLSAHSTEISTKKLGMCDFTSQCSGKLSRVAGPFASSSLPEVHYSRFGVIPKNHQPNKWRLIVSGGIQSTYKGATTFNYFGGML